VEQWNIELNMNQIEHIIFLINNTSERIENNDNICPIGFEPIINPVTIKKSGQTYDALHLSNYIKYQKKYNNNSDMIKEPILKMKFNCKRDIYSNLIIKKIFENNKLDIYNNISLILDFAKDNKIIIKYIYNNIFISFLEVIECILKKNMIDIFLIDDIYDNCLMNTHTINVACELNISDKISFSTSYDIIKKIINNKYFFPDNKIDFDIFNKFIKKNNAFDNIGIDIINKCFAIILNSHKIEYIFDNVNTNNRDNISNKIIDYFNNNNEKFTNVNLLQILLKTLKYCKCHCNIIKILLFMNKNLKKNILDDKIIINFIYNMNNNMCNNKKLKKKKNKINNTILDIKLKIVCNLKFELFTLFYNSLWYSTKIKLINLTNLSDKCIKIHNKKNIIINLLKLEKNNKLIKLIERNFLKYMNINPKYNKNLFLIISEFYKIWIKQKYFEKKIISIIKIISRTPQNIIKNNGLFLLTKIYKTSNKFIKKFIYNITLKMSTNIISRRLLLKNEGIKFIILKLKNYC
jgi:hypothetical protein